MKKILALLKVRSLKDLIGKTMLISFTEDNENKFEHYFVISSFTICNGVLEITKVPAPVSRNTTFEIEFLPNGEFELYIHKADMTEYGSYFSNGSKSDRLSKVKIEVIK